MTRDDISLKERFKDFCVRLEKIRYASELLTFGAKDVKAKNVDGEHEAVSRFKYEASKIREYADDLLEDAIIIDTLVNKSPY